MVDSSVRPLAARATSESGGGWTAVIVVSFVAMVLVQEYVALSFTMVSMALPSISAEFVTMQGGWLLTGFLLSGAVLSPLFGKMADLYGKRRILLLVLAITGLGGVIAATAPSLSLLIVGRCLEGASVAGLFLSYSLMRDVYSPKILPLAVSLCTTGIGVFAVGVPFLVGWLLEEFGFRGLFWFDVVVIVVLLGLIRVSTPETPIRKPATLDILGGLLLGAGIACILVAVSMGGNWGWASANVVGFVIAGVVMLAAFRLRSKRVSEPVVDLALFASRPILMTATAGALIYGAFTIYGSMFPMLAMTPRGAGGDYGLGMSPTAYATVAAPGALALVLGGVVVGKLIRRVGGRRCILAGCLLIIFGGLSIAFFNDTYSQFVIAAVLFGLGTGLTLAAVPNLVIENTPAEDQGSISANVQVALAILSSTAPVVMFAVLTAHAVVTPAGVVYAEAGFRNSSLLAVGLALFAFVLMVTVFRPSLRTAPVTAAQQT